MGKIATALINPYLEHQALLLHSAIIDGCEFGLIILDSKKQVVIWNQWIVEHTLINLENAQGNAIEDLFPQIKGKRAAQCIDSSLQAGNSTILSTALNPYPFNLHAIKSDQESLIPQSVTIKPIYDLAGTRFCMIQIADVSHTASREKLLKEQSAKADQARREAEKLSTVKSQFTSMVSHELRTPLTAIHGALKLIGGAAIEKIPEKLVPLFDIADRNTERLLILINDLLDVHKMEAGKLEYVLKNENLCEIVKQSIESNQTYCQKYDIQFKLVQSVDKPMVLIDNNRIQQVISNLLSNAAKFSPSHSTVDLSITRSNTRAQVSVKDFGSGIPLEFQKHIFDQFSQADASNTRISGGTGLGLCISKTIVEEHDGNIWFESEPGKGTTFYFDLPLAQ